MKLDRLTLIFRSLQRQILRYLHQKNEPQIIQRHDQQGNLHYQVYDPMTVRSASFSSASEVRWWLEQRYSHQEWR